MINTEPPRYYTYSLQRNLSLLSEAHTCHARQALLPFSSYRPFLILINWTLHCYGLTLQLFIYLFFYILKSLLWLGGGLYTELPRPCFLCWRQVCVFSSGCIQNVLCVLKGIFYIGPQTGSTTSSHRWQRQGGIKFHRKLCSQSRIDVKL